MAPVVLFVVAVGLGLTGAFFNNTVILGTAVLAFSLACLSMVGVLLVALVDARHDEG